jgi:hypothetical protein
MQFRGLARKGRAHRCAALWRDLPKGRWQAGWLVREGLRRDAYRQVPGKGVGEFGLKNLEDHANGPSITGEKVFSRGDRRDRKGWIIIPAGSISCLTWPISMNSKTC